MSEPADSAPSDAVSSGSSRHSPRLIVLGGALGVVAACVVWSLGAILWNRESIPLLTEAALDQAEARWQANRPAGYNLDLTIRGRQPGVVHIEVRGNTVAAMTRDGRIPSQRRTWDYWTVDNQFDTIRQDMNSAQDPAGGFGAPPGSQVVQRAEFDAKYGYPARYRRFVLGTPLEVQWDITRFQVVE